jgi:hypothetical protein
MIFFVLLDLRLALQLVSPSTEGQTLTAFALERLKGHVQDENGLSMMTVGVDARCVG